MMKFISIFICCTILLTYDNYASLEQKSDDEFFKSWVQVNQQGEDEKDQSHTIKADVKELPNKITPIHPTIHQTTDDHSSDITMVQDIDEIFESVEKGIYQMCTSIYQFFNEEDLDERDI